MRCLVLTLPILLAHSWYDPACCSDKDCDPLTRESTVTHVNGGYQVTVKPGDDPVFFSQEKVRPSQDGLYHACIGISTRMPFCLYIPMGA